MKQYDSREAFERGEPRKGRHSGFEALRHLDPPVPLLVRGYGVNGPGDLSITDAARAMAARRNARDTIVRGQRIIASWTTRESHGRPAGSFSYSFFYAAEDEQNALRSFRDDPAIRV